MQEPPYTLDNCSCSSNVTFRIRLSLSHQMWYWIFPGPANCGFDTYKERDRGIAYHQGQQGGGNNHRYNKQQR